MGSISFVADLSLPLSVSHSYPLGSVQGGSGFALAPHFPRALGHHREEQAGLRVLQIQQGQVREKSYMQISEEKMGKKWHVPRIGLFAFPITHIRGGSMLNEKKLATAVEKAREQWEEGVKDELQMVSEWFEPIGGDLELPVNGEG